jgi:hypothetical protein
MENREVTKFFARCIRITMQVKDFSCKIEWERSPLMNFVHVYGA